MTLASEQQPRSVILHAIGTEFTNWGNQPAYIARTHPLDQTLELWKPAAEIAALPAGTHTFPFAIELPGSLPPSFDGLLTEIGYGLKAKVDLPRQLDLHAELGFIVLGVVVAPVEEPITVEAHDEAGRHIELNLPKSVYQLGETINGTVRIVRLGMGHARRLTIELISKEVGSAQGVSTEYSEREADFRVELEHVTEDSTYPFLFQAPDSAAPTFHAEHSDLTWHVHARLDVAHGQDVVAQVEVTVAEPE